jgi:hypothetical protein
MLVRKSEWQKDVVAECTVYVPQSLICSASRTPSITAHCERLILMWIDDV